MSRRPLRRLAIPALAVLLLGAFAAQEERIEVLREEAREIVRGVQDREIPIAEARVRVERLLRALLALGEESGFEPSRRRLEVSIANTGPGERDGGRPTDECPLFFEERLVQLCPLDQSRSEIWGSQVLVCEFACAPAPDEPR